MNMDNGLVVIRREWGKEKKLNVLKLKKKKITTGCH